MDYYSVSITTLPTINGEQITIEELFEYVRTNFSYFLRGGKTQMTYYSDKEEEIWLSENPLSAVIKFDAYVGREKWYDNLDDFGVITSQFTPGNNWIFSTLTTYLDAGHPLSGNRQFGVTTSPFLSPLAPQTYTFYTRAADRPHTWIDWAGAGFIFSGADKLWRALMNNVATYVNENNGIATVSPNNGAKRYEWKD